MNTKLIIVLISIIFLSCKFENISVKKELINIKLNPSLNITQIPFSGRTIQELFPLNVKDLYLRLYTSNAQFLLDTIYLDFLTNTNISINIETNKSYIFYFSTLPFNTGEFATPEQIHGYFNIKNNIFISRIDITPNLNTPPMSINLEHVSSALVIQSTNNILIPDTIKFIQIRSTGSFQTIDYDGLGGTGPPGSIDTLINITTEPFLYTSLTMPGVLTSANFQNPPDTPLRLDFINIDTTSINFIEVSTQYIYLNPNTITLLEFDVSKLSIPSNITSPNFTISLMPIFETQIDTIKIN